MPSVGGQKNFQSFTMICRKRHVASSIFQNPKGTMWTHCNECIEENIHNEITFSSIVLEIKENIYIQPLNYVQHQVFYKRTPARANQI
jgi:hypothetical protein